ncbi:MAG: hypothetical protein V3T22_03670, partial [Planctomycetota bacterium]
IDDAFISFRYARNWAESGVPAYDLGGGLEPVEGYSNFLWVLLLKWCFQIGLPLEWDARALSILMGGATVLLLDRVLRRGLGLGPLPAALGTISLAAFPPFVVWCTGGLETACFSLLLLACFALLTRPGAERERLTGTLAGLCAVCLALVRVEGFLWVLAVAGCAWLANKMRSETHVGHKRFGSYFVVYLLGFGAFLLWRHATYGEWLANTVQAKAGIDGEGVVRGLKTTASFLLLFPGVLIVLLAAPIALRGPENGPARGAALGALGMVVLLLGYNTLVGGDWMPFFRFLAPAAPFVALMLAVVCARLGARAGVTLTAICVGLSITPLFGGSLVPRGVREALYFRSFQRVGYQTEWERWEKGVQNLAMFSALGRGLRQIAQPQDSLTFGAIGAVGYYSRMRIHDRNGLVDREVALRPTSGAERTAGHDKRVPRAFFLPRSPTLFHAVLVPGPIGPEGSQSWEQALRVVEQRVWGQGPGEEPLRGACLPEVHALHADEGIPQGSSLMVLRATPDSSRARAFWSRRPR